ncbi:MAG TPA: DedA family protein [Rhodopila sp.]|uniref:DedA family protein n=1 Tax=Rhodopila sp. TaxID=2480087 RepID=UPI002D0A1415|nr:DedA family protein [Rhodopila sp.]HVY14137.1 DedA family protein [Rhodopila sp.]
MWSWIDTLAGLVAGNPTEALALVFAAAVVEALAVVGTLLPGTVILMAVAGAAAITGHGMLPFVLAAILGAVIGDGLSYWIGHHFRGRLRGVWPFSRRPGLLESAERFFRRYGVTSVALCRFIPVLRSNVPLFAGMANMPPRAFFVANILSALAWAPAHIYPAQFAGLSLDRIRNGDWVGAALWGGLLLACLMVAWAVHRWAAAVRRGSSR